MKNNRKVREDFDLTRGYSVDVVGCCHSEKKQVQQAFFDVGMPWEYHDENYVFLEAAQYSNVTLYGQVTSYCLYGTSVEGCNMTAEEFLDLVYESEVEGHIHAELMAQYAEDARTCAEPWEMWQFKCNVTGIWRQCREHPSWWFDSEYRRKPKTKLVHGVEVPDIGLDLSKYEERTDFYAPCVRSYKYHVGLSHHKHNNCTRFSQSGIAYPYTEEGKQAAILHAKAMLGIV